MVLDVVESGKVVFTGNLKEVDDYVDSHISEAIVVVDHNSFNVSGALKSLEQLKKALEKAGTFGCYAGDYRLIRQFLEKEAK